MLFQNIGTCCQLNVFIFEIKTCLYKTYLKKNITLLIFFVCIKSWTFLLLVLDYMKFTSPWEWAVLLEIILECDKFKKTI